jgi:hypothetical protein
MPEISRFLGIIITMYYGSHLLARQNQPLENIEPLE